MAGKHLTQRIFSGGGGRSLEGYVLDSGVVVALIKLSSFPILGTPPFGRSQGREGDDMDRGARRRHDAGRLGREMDPPPFGPSQGCKGNYMDCGARRRHNTM